MTPPRLPVVAVVVAVALALASVGACGDGATGPGTDPGAPSVVATSPRSHAVGADRSAPLTLTVDAPLDAASVPGALVVSGRWSGPVPGALGLSADGLTVTFSPARPFAAGEVVTVTARAGALRGRDGRPLARGWSWTFWAAASPGSLLPVFRSSRAMRRPGEGPIQTYGAFAGDLDGDGDGDLVFPNEEADDLRILLNDGAGGFGPLTIVPIPGARKPSTNEGADFDGDGDLDFAVGSVGNGSVNVFLGGGDGTLTHAARLDAGASARGLCVVDLENDGDPDLVVTDAGEGGQVGVFTNAGEGTFRRTQTIDAGTGEWACAVADADLDGLLDVYVGARGSAEVVVLLSVGDGTLRRGGAAPASGDPWMLGAADLDGDGDADLVGVGASASALLVLRGDGAGGLAAAETLPLGAFPLAVDLGDLDGDGDLDVVTSSFGAAVFTVLENRGGTLVQAGMLASPSAASCTLLHDRDGDGDLDITGVDEKADVVLFFENG